MKIKLKFVGHMDVKDKNDIPKKMEEFTKAILNLSYDAIYSLIKIEYMDNNED